MLRRLFTFFPKVSFFGITFSKIAYKEDTIKWSTDTAMEETDSESDSEDDIARERERETDKRLCRLQTMWIVDFHLVVNVSLTPLRPTVVQYNVHQCG